MRSGVKGTPCLFVNGQLYDGPRDVETIAAALEDTMPELLRTRRVNETACTGDERLPLRSKWKSRELLCVIFPPSMPF